jgi:uncharacterized membrane protein
MNGKGSTQRPVNKLAFDLSFDRIFRSRRKRKEEEKVKAQRKPTTQEQQVIDYITEHGTITQAVATRQLSVSRLSARIWDLKKIGYEFERAFIYGENAHGKTVRYVSWSMKS